MNNFNKDWSDGIAIGALVDAVAPGLFPEWEDLDPKDKVNNAHKAMKMAEDWLGVPQVGHQVSFILLVLIDLFSNVSLLDPSPQFY